MDTIDIDRYYEVLRVDKVVNPIAKDLRTPKYKKRVVPDKKKKASKEKCRKK